VVAPVTHVSAWAKPNEGDIVFNRHCRESGGWAGCGGGVFGLEAGDLTVLPDVGWVALREMLTFKGRVAAVKGEVK
jgi:hypothetical protein